MTPPIKPYDVVALTEDLPQHGLVRGQVGTIVEQYAPDAFEVEFTDPQGRAYAMLALHPSQLLVLLSETGFAEEQGLQTAPCGRGKKNASGQ